LPKPSHQLRARLDRIFVREREEEEEEEERLGRERERERERERGRRIPAQLNRAPTNCAPVVTSSSLLRL
jgi:hypothetical protein